MKNFRATSSLSACFVSKDFIIRPRLGGHLLWLPILIANHLLPQLPSIGITGFCYYT